jgi:hypothetical protein
MRQVRVSRVVLAAGFVAAGVLSSGAACAAAGEGEMPQIAEARATGRAADFLLRYIQEDGPESGHVRVVMTPEVRSVTIIEARMAAEQAFLDALDDPGLGDELKRITVVVRLAPISQLEPGGAGEQVIVYLHKGGKDWSVRAGE